MSLSKLYFFLVVAVLLGFAPSSAKASLTAAGSGANLGITRLLVSAFMEQNPGITIDVPGSIGSKGAITAIKDNAITFGLLSRPLKDKEQSAEYTLLAYGSTPVVIAAHSFVKDTSLSSNELVSIYKGTKSKWSDGNEIIVQLREAFDSGFMELEKVIPGFKEVCDESRKTERWTTYFTDQEANKALAGTPFAIGITDMGMIATEKLNVKPLQLDGITPRLETLANGSYPLKRTLYFLYREKELPAEAKAFLDFVRSDKGAAILETNGYLALMKKSDTPTTP